MVEKRAIIPALWKSTCPPTIADWWTRLVEIQVMENLTMALNRRRSIGRIGLLTSITGIRYCLHLSLHSFSICQWVYWVMKGGLSLLEGTHSLPPSPHIHLPSFVFNFSFLSNIRLLFFLRSLRSLFYTTLCFLGPSIRLSYIKVISGNWLLAT